LASTIVIEPKIGVFQHNSPFRDVHERATATRTGDPSPTSPRWSPASTAVDPKRSFSEPSERCVLRPSDAYSADGWEDALGGGLGADGGDRDAHAAHAVETQATTPSSTSLFNSHSPCATAGAGAARRSPSRRRRRRSESNQMALIGARFKDL